MAIHLNLMTAQAQAQAQGRVRLVFFFSNGNFNGDGVSFGLELPKNPFHYNYSLTGIRRRRRRRRSSLEQVEQSPNKLLLRRRSCFSSASSRIHSSFSSASSLNNTNNKKHTSDYSSDDDDDDDEFGEMDDLGCFRGLVLDVSYRPINVVCWKRAICLEFMEKADVLEYYDQTVNSATGSFYIPAVLRVPHLLQVVKRRRINANLSRKNILHRDAYTCQYCSSRGDLTIDHVIPAARGGDWKWENLVTACAKCNSKKGHKTLEEANMKLSKVPKAPKDYDILAIPLTTAAIKMLNMRQRTPEEWRQYLS